VKLRYWHLLGEKSSGCCNFYWSTWGRHSDCSRERLVCSLALSWRTPLVILFILKWVNLPLWEIDSGYCYYADVASWYKAAALAVSFGFPWLWEAAWPLLLPYKRASNCYFITNSFSLSCCIAPTKSTYLNGGCKYGDTADETFAICSDWTYSFLFLWMP